MKRVLKAVSAALLLAGGISGCAYLSETAGLSTPDENNVQTPTDTLKSTANLSVPFEKYQLENGLTVILHQDKSDPIVAITTLVHAGSSREKPGRTGFAHFFEHMAFNDSENVPQGANRKMIEELGGTRNGGTWTDGTIYYEVVPKDAFEKLLWIDSDRLGFMINTVSEGALEREKQVVKNEKRQRVDNQAYGHTDYVIRKNLYPESHPYNWTVIGELEDLQNATLSDVKEFYAKYYGPNNAVLSIAGDIDIEETKELVEKWFGEIKKGQEVEPLEPQKPRLHSIKKLYHLDTFAKVPELRMTFPTVKSFHKDSYALDALGQILSQGKRAPLYQVIVEQEKLAPSVSAYNYSAELAGTFTLRIRAHAGVDLDDVYSAVKNAFAEFEKNGVDDKDVQIIKAKLETNFLEGISSVLNKSQQLAQYEMLAGDPAYLEKEIANIKSVTKFDIQKAFRKYIKNENFILTSFVPKSQPELAVEGSEQAEVVEEKIVANAESKFDPNEKVTYEKTPTKLDRSEPPLGDTPKVKLPNIKKITAKNGMSILNIEHNELPLVNFSVQIKGGAWLESFDKLGAANILAQMLNEGTASKTPEQLQDAIGMLGASVRVSSDIDSINITGSTLARNFDETMALVAEMILEPRWDVDEFNRIRNNAQSRIRQSEARPYTVAMKAFNKQSYGEKHRAGWPTNGTLETVANIKLNDIKKLYREAVVPSNAAVHVVGDLPQTKVISGVGKLISEWQGEDDGMPIYPEPNIVKKPKVYFIDIPNAKQSVIVMGKPAMSANDPDFYLFEVAQNRLGGGGSARLFQTLRIEKGYTYGAYSTIQKRDYLGAFMAYAQVRSNVTLESLEVFKSLVSQYDETYTQKDLDMTKNLLIKKNTRRFETLGNLLSLLEDVSAYNLPWNVIELQQDALLELSLDDAKSIYQRYANEQEMIYVVVGDAKTQLENVKKFGYGDPIILDRQGNKL